MIATGDALARLEIPPDLFLMNRFGKSEAEGSGLRSLFKNAFLSDLSVLTCINDVYRTNWARYTGSLGVCLPAQEDVILAKSHALDGE